MWSCLSWFNVNGRYLQPVQAKKKDKIMTMDPKEITFDMVNKKMREILAARGRKGTDKQEQV
jgi:translation initiation factor 3 subunit C